MKKLSIVLLLAAVVLIGLFVWNKNNEPADTTTSKQTNTHQDSEESGFNKQRYSLDDPSSPWVIANKQRPLTPKNYAPTDLVVPDVPLRVTDSNEEMRLRKEAATALEALFGEARRSGYKLMVASAYRSYAYQQGLYNHYVEVQGKAVADTQSARPGHSEHQTGLAVDVEPESRNCEVEECFAETPEGRWAAKNAHLYGFIIRYPKNKQATTGYIYEPWHLRYVGEELANEVFNEGNVTLEEFFDLPAAPDYN